MRTPLGSLALYRIWQEQVAYLVILISDNDMAPKTLHVDYPSYMAPVLPGHVMLPPSR